MLWQGHAMCDLRKMLPLGGPQSPSLPVNDRGGLFSKFFLAPWVWKGQWYGLIRPVSQGKADDRV